MKLKLIGNISDTTTLQVLNSETGERLELVQEISIVARAGAPRGRVTIEIIDLELDVTVDDPKLVKVKLEDVVNCRDCGCNCDPSDYRCEECESAYQDATSCPTCRCPNTGGDICDGCDDVNREEAGDDE